MSQPVVDAITARFRALGIRAQLSEHPAVRTSEEAAAIRGVPLASGVKALVCRTSEGAFVLVLVKGDERADLARLAQLVGTKKLALATPEEVLHLTDCEPGAVPPFSALPTYFDRRIREGALARARAGANSDVNFNIGLRTHSATIPEPELERALGAFTEY